MTKRRYNRQSCLLPPMELAMSSMCRKTYPASSTTCRFSLTGLQLLSSLAAHPRPCLIDTDRCSLDLPALPRLCHMIDGRRVPGTQMALDKADSLTLATALGLLLALDERPLEEVSIKMGHIGLLPLSSIPPGCQRQTEPCLDQILSDRLDHERITTPLLHPCLGVSMVVFRIQPRLSMVICIQVL